MGGLQQVIEKTKESPENFKMLENTVTRYEPIRYRSDACIMSKTDRKVIAKQQEFYRKLDKYGHPDLFPEERRYNIFHFFIQVLIMINLLLIGVPLIKLLDKHIGYITIEQIDGEYNVHYNNEQ